MKQISIDFLRSMFDGLLLIITALSIAALIAAPFLFENSELLWSK